MTRVGTARAGSRGQGVWPYLAAVLAALLAAGLGVVVVAWSPPAGEPGGAGAAAETAEPAVDGARTLERLAGSDRFATAAAVADAAFPNGADTAFVATGTGFADALAGGPAAASRDAPLLLTAPDVLPGATGEALTRLGPDRIVVLGGRRAVGPAVVEALASHADDVERWAGADRFATAAAVAARTHDDAEQVWLATGAGFADALAGGAAAAHHDAPVLLVGPRTLPPATAAALADLAPDRLTVLGGTSAVADAVAADAARAAGLDPDEVVRLAGSERSATARAVAEHAFADAPPDTAYVATGAGFADALAGVPAAARDDAPMLLVVGAGEVARGALDSLGVSRAVMVGGPAAVDERALSTDPRDHHFLLTDHLDARLDRAALPAAFGYALVDPQGRLVHGRGADTPLLPASTQKLVTAASALATLGGDHRLATAVHATAPVVDGVVDGDLVVVGGGDPALADRAFAQVRDRRPRTPAESLADAVADAGVRAVRGDVLGHGGVLPWQPQAEGWPPRYLEDGDTTRSAGLTVNAGYVVLGDGPGAELEPAARPAGSAAAVTHRLLGDAGVSVDGGSGVTDDAAPDGEPLAVVRSPEVRELLAHTLTWSDNHLADTLWRMTGRVDGDGSWASGAGAAEAALADLGVDPAGARFADGSGLSRANRLTARQLATLDAAMSGAHGRDWDGLKAVAGATGTLRHRLGGTEAAGSLRAKTGWLRDVRALAGSVHGGERRWHLAVLGNGLDRASSAAVRDLTDEIAVVLARHARGCPLDGC